MTNFFTGSLQEAVQKMRYLLKGHEGKIIHEPSEPCVLTGAQFSMSEDACRERNLYVGRAGYIGGTIVCMPNDLNVFSVTWGNTDWAKNAIRHINDWLNRLGLNAVIDNNDILVDDKKVASYARVTYLTGWCQSGFHFSCGDMDLELISAVCEKEMRKIPGTLKDHNVSAEMILSELRRSNFV